MPIRETCECEEYFQLPRDFFFWMQLSSNFFFLFWIATSDSNICVNILIRLEQFETLYCFLFLFVSLFLRISIHSLSHFHSTDLYSFNLFSSSDHTCIRRINEFKMSFRIGRMASEWLSHNMEFARKVIE